MTLSTLTNLIANLTIAETDIGNIPITMGNANSIGSARRNVALALRTLEREMVEIEEKE